MKEESRTNFFASRRPDDEFGAVCVCVWRCFVRDGTLQGG